MMRESRHGSAETLLQAANRQTRLARPHQDAIGLKPGRIAQRLKLLGGVFDLHIGSISHRGCSSIHHSNNIEIWLRASK